MNISGVKPVRQRTNWTCGVGALRTVFHFYSVNVSEKELCTIGVIGEEGTGFSTMRMLAREYGFSFWATSNGNINKVKRWLSKNIPVLVCWQLGTPNGKNGHYSVITGIDDRFVTIADPSNYMEDELGKFAITKKMTIKKFVKHWFEVDDGITFKKWYAVIRPKLNERQRKTKHH